MLDRCAVALEPGGTDFVEGRQQEGDDRSEVVEDQRLVTTGLGGDRRALAPAKPSVFRVSIAAATSERLVAADLPVPSATKRLDGPDFAIETPLIDHIEQLLNNDIPPTHRKAVSGDRDP